MKTLFCIFFIVIFSSQLNAHDRWRVHIGLEDIIGATKYSKNGTKAEFDRDKETSSTETLLNRLYLAILSPRTFFTSSKRYSYDYRLDYRTIINTKQVVSEEYNASDNSDSVYTRTTGVFLTPTLYYKWQIKKQHLIEPSIGLGIGLISSKGNAKELETDDRFDWNEKNTFSMSVHVGISYTYMWTHKHQYSIELFGDELHSRNISYLTSGLRIYYSYSFH